MDSANKALATPWRLLHDSSTVLGRTPQRLAPPRFSAAPPAPTGTLRAARVPVRSIRDQPAHSDTDELSLVSLVTVKAILSAAQDSAPDARIPGLSGVDLAAIVDPTLGVARAELGRLLENIAAELRDEAVGLTLGKSLGSSHFHVAGPLIMNSTTGRQALQCFLGLRRGMLGGPAWRLTVAQGEAKFGHPLARFRGAKAEADFGIALAYRALLDFWGSSVRPALRVEFACRQPADQSRYDALFSGRVRFGAELNCVAFPEALLDQERPGGDQKLAAELAAFTLESYLQREHRGWWSHAVRLALASAPSLRGMDVESVGAQFQLSARTLRRRLEREGANFRKLLEEVRLERARQLLRTTTADIDAISVALGYEEVNAFRRAFKSWAGQSPSSFREGV
jgi:AraC-like DNA-binding protein